MSNYKRPVIIWGNSFYINIELKQFNKDTSDYEYFDLTKCHDVKVNLICATHNTVIPLEWNLLDGYNYIIRCFVDYRLLHNTSYGIEVEGLNEDDIHWRWYMLPKEGILVVNNSSGLNIPDEVTTVDLAGRVGWGIQTDADLTNYYTKTEVNNLINESTDNSPYILECWQEIDEDLRKTLAEYIQNSRDIILHEGDGADLKLFEYTIGRDNEVTFMVFHTDMGEEGTSEVTQYYWRIPYDQEANNGWSVSVIDFLTSSDRLEVTWDGVAISDGAEDPTYTFKIWGNHTYKDFIELVNEGKTIQLAIHPEDQNSVAHGYRGVPDYSVTLFTCYSAINVITTYFYAVLYNYFEWEGRVTSNGLYVYVLRVDPDKTEYPNDQTKWKIKLTEERIDTIEMQKKTDENTEQLDNIELNTNNNNLILQTTLDETPKVFSRVGMKTINNQTLFGDGNIDIQGGGTSVQSDWDETDTTSPAYIQNKPDIQSIEGSITDVQNDIDNLEDDIAAQQAEISGVQTAISGHQTAIEAQATEISGMQTQISGHQTALENNASDINGIQSAISGHQTAIENLDTEKQDVLESGVNIKTINNESILGEGNITIESGGDVEPAKIVVTDEEVQNPEQDAVYIVQKPINLKTINGEEIVGEGNIVIESGASEDENTSYTIDLNSYETDTYRDDQALNELVQYLHNGGRNLFVGDGYNIEKPVYYGYDEDGENHTQTFYIDMASYPDAAPNILCYYAYNITGTWDSAWETVLEVNFEKELHHFDDPGNMQANWNERDSTSIQYIQNKPDISGMQTEISGVQTAISGHQTAIQNQATEISGIQSNISGMQTEISGMQTQISGHQTALEAQATEISGIQTTIAGHQTAIQNQATEISGMQTVLAGHQTALENQSGVTQVQSDWSQTDTTAVDYIKNKPTIPKLIIPSVYCDSNSVAWTRIGQCTGYVLRSNSFMQIIFTNSFSTTSLTKVNINNTGDYYLRVNGAAAGTSGIRVNAGIYIMFFDGEYYYIDTTGRIPTIPKTSDLDAMVTSTTSGLKIEVVSALPASPDTNTIYIIQ